MATPTSLPASFVSGAVLTAAEMNNLRGAFRVLQVVSTTKTDTFSTASTTFTNLTGLAATITPSATSSKILIVTQIPSAAGDTYHIHFKLTGGNTASYVGDAASNRIRDVYTKRGGNEPGQMTSHIMLYLDSPATTSATTYQVQVRMGTGGTGYINRSDSDADTAASGRGASTITVMEISA